ncbi:MAG: hypothetical protein CMK32_00930 [Porticoccaceae bacterium]|nr:hypothetical protein [Porticoccaceae bacterium]
MTLDSILPLLQNAALLLALLVIFETVRAEYQHYQSPLQQVGIGLITGAIGVCLMLTPFQYVPGIIFDTRSVLLALVGVFFAPGVTVTTIVITAIHRLMQGGMAAWTGVAVIIASGGLGILWRHLKRERLHTLTWQELYSFGLVVHIVMLGLMLTLPSMQAMAVLADISLPVLLIFPTATALVGTLMARGLAEDRTHKQLKISEERLRLALAAGKIGLTELDIETGVFKVSDDYARLLGYEPDEFEETYSSALERSDPAVIPGNQALMETYLATATPDNPGELRLELHLRGKNGSWRWLNSVSRVVEWDDRGRPSRLIGTHVDVTEEKKAAQALADAQQKTSALLEQSNKSRLALLSALEDRQQTERELQTREAMLREVGRIARVGGWELDVDTRKVHYTAEMFTVLGMPERGPEPLEKAVEIIDPGQRDEAIRFLDNCITQAEPFDVELRCLRHNAAAFWVRVIGKPVIENGVVRKITGSLQDIDARKQAEYDREQSYDLLVKLAAQVPGAIYQYQQFPDGSSCFPWSSPGIEDIYEVTPEEVREDAKPVTKRLHPDDRQRVVDEITQSAERLTPFHSEYRVILPRQGLKWRLCNAIPERVEDGSTLWHGMITDITERKASEEALRLASLVYRNSSEGMVVTDPDGTIVDINATFSEVTGYSAEEVVGKKPSLLKSGRHSRAFYQTMWEDLLRDGHWEGEIWNRRKNGEIYPESLVINAAHNPDGSVHRWVAQFSDITEKKQAEQLIWRQANYDQLTGLPNRRMVQDRLVQDMKKSQRSGMPLALLFLDLDRFKEVNDTLGHEKGDLLLQEAAQRLTQCVRETDTVGRLGGDEFIILMGDLKELASIERVTHDVLDAMSKPFDLGNDLAFISASIGITLYPDDGETSDDLLKNADQAMYAAKRGGRNNYQYFTPAMQHAALERMDIINDLRKALAEDQLWVAYQPIISLATGRLHKAEALVRWNHPDKGPVGPNVFIPIAEDTGMIFDIGRRVIFDAAERAKQWRGEIHENFQVSVNISPVQLHNHDHSVFNALRDSLANSTLNSAIVLEITEGILLDMSAEVREQLLAFRDAGIQVALDDFGTGYSSLSYLKKFDIDYIKIDQSFISTLREDNEDMVLCEAIIAMAHKLGIMVIAEGVETEEQARLLTGIGCDFAQGYYFSPPIPARAFAEFNKRLQGGALSCQATR